MLFYYIYEHSHHLYLTDTHENHQNEINAKENIESVGTQYPVDKKDIYGREYGEHFCMLHHNLNCHYYQIKRKENICDNHNTYSNSNVEYNLNSPEALEETEYHRNFKTNNLSYTSEGTETSGNKLTSSKVKKAGKGKKHSSSNITRKTLSNKDLCSHCHCSLPQTYTRQKADDGGETIENKETANVLGHVVEEEDYRGKF